MSVCPRSDDAAAFALQQLTADEARQFTRHRRCCETCQLTLEDVMNTLDLLPLSIPPEPPPPDLRAKLLQRIAVTERSAPDLTRATAPNLSPKPLRLLPRLRRLAALATVAAALLVLVLVWQATSRPQAVLAYAMSGTDAAPMAAADVTCTPIPAGTRMTLIASGLPPLAPGESYQLWLIKDGIRTSGGVFILDAAGHGGLTTLLPGKPAFDALGVTREPDAFGQQPRGESVLNWANHQY